jgi:bacillithiol biosynthesis cysteine-adding enzyme BshC
MECTCIRHTDLPHTSKLFADLIYHPDRVRSFYPSSSGFEAAARRIRWSPERRAALVSVLREQNGDSPSLDLLSRPDTVAVVTGQQVGLFSGPAYTIYKALTAAKLARDLTARGIPSVPVFWLATEDHDFAEVNHFWTFDAGHHPIKLQIDGRAPANQPVGEVKLTETPLAELRETLRQFPFGEDTVALVADAYAPGTTLGQAFGTLLKRLLAKYDVPRIDPMSPAARDLAAPAIRAALASASELTSQVLERNRELEAAGYHAQVHVEDHTSFVFLLENGRRTTLRRHNREYISNGRRFSTEELMERANQLSPNALLRPVVQDWILPTAAYIGGPAELAYLAQAEVIYRAVLGYMPVALNRTGFTLLDQRSRKLMSRYGLNLADFFHGEDVLRERIASRLIPPSLAQVLEETRKTTEQSAGRLTRELAAFDPTLQAALGKSRKKMLYQLEKIERKIGREAMARDERAAREAAYLYGLIYPNRHLQERLYSIIPFVARHGLDLIDHLYENVRLDCPDHQLLVI